MRIITLTSDFGTSDGYVGAMKGVIASRAPLARVVDIAHDVPSFNIVAGAYCLRQASSQFPPGTIHVCVVDPGVGGRRRAVIVDNGDHVFVGPDNGLFSWVAPRPRAVYSIESLAFMRPEVSATFHGRDVFAAAAACLAAGAEPREAGPQVELSPLAAGDIFAVTRQSDGSVHANVVHVDRFGNLITGCGVEALPENPQIHVLGTGHVVERLSRTFADVAPGELLAYIGSANTLEIAVREHSAARILGSVAGDTVAIVPGGARARSRGDGT